MTLTNVKSEKQSGIGCCTNIKERAVDWEVSRNCWKLWLEPNTWINEKGELSTDQEGWGLMPHAVFLYSIGSGPDGSWRPPVQAQGQILC